MSLPESTIKAAHALGFHVVQFADGKYALGERDEGDLATLHLVGAICEGVTAQEVKKWLFDYASNDAREHRSERDRRTRLVQTAESALTILEGGAS